MSTIERRTYSGIMKIVPIKLTFLVFWALFYVAYASSVKFVYDATLNDSVCLSSDVLFNDIYASRITCSAICARIPSCRTIFYKQSTNECRGCSGSYIKGDRLDVFEGSRHYKKRDGNMYIGCYVDSENRTMSDVKTYDTTSMTTTMCYEYCMSYGMRLMLMEGAWECYCGNQLKTVVKASDNDCWYPCAGNSAEKCGGDWRGSVYDTMLYVP